jgi:putative flippase GtrA
LRRTAELEKLVEPEYIKIEEFVASEQEKRKTTRQGGSSASGWMGLILQIIRFGFVGGLNTFLDLLIFNAFLFLFPTNNTFKLLLYNSIAYALGGINSFILNKYWTFDHKQKTTHAEILRFAITTLVGIGCNDLLIWLISGFAHPFIANTQLWANTSKIVAIFGTVLISYLGMRLWVFVKPAQPTTAEN